MIFEKKKAEMGLFMPDQAVETVIGQCRAFLEMGTELLVFDVCRSSDGLIH